MQLTQTTEASSSLEEDAFAVVVPGKVALFDLAGTEVSKFPSLEGCPEGAGWLLYGKAPPRQAAPATPPAEGNR